MNNEDKSKCIDNAFKFLKDKNDNSSVYDKPSRTLARCDHKSPNGT
ncbi:hypothetical protein HYH98_01735 [Clostridium botulinum]|nr:hypothetical protein CIT17_11695 [Clostridium botulinum]MBY6985325.1 hypothetical protein [Clostridium botulinum]